jgi:hypothetical protein
MARPNRSFPQLHLARSSNLPTRCGRRESSTNIDEVTVQMSITAADGTAITLVSAVGAVLHLVRRSAPVCKAHQHAGREHFPHCTSLRTRHLAQSRLTYSGMHVIHVGDRVAGSPVTYPHALRVDRNIRACILLAETADLRRNIAWMSADSDLLGACDCFRSYWPMTLCLAMR